MSHHLPREQAVRIARSDASTYHQSTMMLNVGLLAACFTIEVGDVVLSPIGEAEVAVTYETTEGQALLVLGACGDEALVAESRCVLLWKRFETEEAQSAAIAVLDRHATPVPPRHLTLDWIAGPETQETAVTVAASAARATLAR